ncbi:MAG: site-specific integrase [Candidatus Thiodiazotropha endolucinida]
MHKVEPVVFPNGERYPMLIDDAGLPHFWATLFITSQVRPSSAQARTLESYLSAIRHFMLWEEIQRRDVFKEFYNLNFLGAIDAELLRDHCMLKAADVKRWHSYQESQKVTPFQKNYPSAPRTLDSVSGDHAKTRYRRIVSYLVFTAKTMLRKRPNVEEINEQIDEMHKELLAKKPKGGKSRTNTNPDDKAPDLEVINDFVAAVQWGSPRNPYKGEAQKKRNALAFNILYDTGMRAGELLGLRLGDIDYQLQVIKVVRRHDDPVDPRAKQPVPKTNPRDIPVTEDLLHQIREYVQEVRANTPGAEMHPYLFVTHIDGPYIGRPLSDSGFVLFVTEAVNKLAQEADSYEREKLIQVIRRHGFRHNFNHMLSLQFDEHNERAKTDPGLKPYTEREQNQIRMYLCGWDSEETAQNYMGRHTVQEARRLMMDDMREHSGKIRAKKKNK